MLSLISGQKSPDASPLLKGNNEATPSMNFISLLGATEDGRGTPGARLHPGEFQSAPASVELLNAGQNSPVTAPLDYSSLRPEASEPGRPSFSIPPQSERIRDSHSYFYAANMSQDSAQSNPALANADQQWRQTEALKEQRTEQATRDQERRIRDDSEYRQQEESRQAERAEAERKRSAEEGRKQESTETRTEKGELNAHKSGEAEKAKEGPEKGQAKEKEKSKESTAEKSEPVLRGGDGRQRESKEIGMAEASLDAWRPGMEIGKLAGISGEVAVDQKEGSDEDKLLQAILSKVAEQKAAESAEAKSGAGEEKVRMQSLWESMISRNEGSDKESLQSIKDKIQSHPEFEKALKAMRDGKDLEQFVKRIVEDLSSGDLKQIKDMVHNAMKSGGEALAGNVKMGPETGKWNVEGPVLSSEVRIRTEEKSSAGGKGSEGGNQQRSDNQNPQFRMDSIATLDARNRMAAENKEAAPFDKKQFQQMVEQARVRLGSDGRSTAQIRLNPEHLGRMQLDLVLKDNVVSGRVIVENQQAFKMLREDLDVLRQELARHGIQLDNLSIKTREAFQSQMSQDHRQNMPFQGQDTGFAEGNEGDRNASSENAENSEKYDSAGPNREEQELAEMSESLLSAVGNGVGRIDLSV